LLSVTFGLASATMIFGWLLAVLPLAAIYFGWRALEQIARVPEEYTGKRVAKTGMAVGATLGIAIGAWLIFGVSDVPYGYQELKWSDLEPGPGEKWSSSAQKLSDDKARVYVRGFILPGRRQVQLSEFSICRTADMCRFAQPIIKANDVIRIKCAGDLTTDHTTHEVGIGGIFHVDPFAPGISPYYMDADCVHK
jgi:hypothetical protein